MTPRPGFTHSTHCFRIWVFFIIFLYIYIRSSSLRVSLFTQRCLTLEAPAANTTVSQTELVQWINIRIYDIILTSFLSPFSSSSPSRSCGTFLLVFVKLCPLNYAGDGGRGRWWNGGAVERHRGRTER